MTEQSDFNPRTVATLFKLSLYESFDAEAASHPLRRGWPHASSILVSESDWCVRRWVLSVLYPELAERPEALPWDNKNNRINRHGWVIHEKHQKLLLKFGGGIQVVCLDGVTPELDNTHFDEERCIHFSPDAIVDFGGRRFVVEIKGYRNEVKGDKDNTSTLLFDRLDEASNPPLAAWRQCNFYMHITGIPYGFVMVEGKNNQEVKIWMIQHDFDMAKPYIDRCYQVKGAAIQAQDSLARGDAVKLPVRKCLSYKDRLAEKCHMRSICFKEG